MNKKEPSLFGISLSVWIGCILGLAIAAVILLLYFAQY